MGNIIELRHVTAEEADAYVCQPSLLIQAERIRQEEFRNLWHSGFDFDQWKKVNNRRSYSYKLLYSLVSVSEEAIDLLVDGGQPIGGLEESWQLEASAKTLSAEQVSQLYNRLLIAPIAPAVELFEIEVAQLFQDLMTFLQHAVEASKALLIIEAP